MLHSVSAKVKHEQALTLVTVKCNMFGGELQVTDKHIASQNKQKQDSGHFQLEVLEQDATMNEDNHPLTLSVWILIACVA